MAQSLQNKVALITGASSGIGEAVAKILTVEGAHLSLFSRNQERLNQIHATCRALRPEGQVTLEIGDVQIAADVRCAVARTIEAFGRIDILINNAGIVCPVKLLHELSFEEIDRVIDTNLKGGMYFMQEVLKVMVKQRSGSVVNINSIAGATAYAGWGIYNASKFGLRGVTLAAAEEYREYNIRVMSIAPGAVRTPIWGALSLSDEPNWDEMLQAEDVAAAVVFALRQEQRTFVPELTIKPLSDVV